MAEPKSDPATRSPDPQSRPEPSRHRQDRLVQIGLDTVSVSMLALIAAGLLVYGGRREISQALAEAWLQQRGIDASIRVDDLDASGFTGSIRLGSRSDPDFVADRIEVAYDLRAPWSGGGYALQTEAIRLVRPRLKARLTPSGLSFGKLQPLIDEALKSPGPRPSRGPSVLIENARLDLRTPGGLARLTGDASLDDGKLLRLDGRLAPLRYDTPDLVTDIRGALVSARKRGDRLSVLVRFDLADLVRQDLELEDTQGQFDADFAYPDLARRSADGPVDLQVAFRADDLRFAETHATRSTGALTLTGQMTGDPSSLQFEGRAQGRVTGEALESPALQGRGLHLDLDVAHLAVGRTAILSGHVAGSAAVTLNEALAGGTALRAVSGQIRTPGLTLSTEGERQIAGPFAVQLGAGRVTLGALALTSLAVDGQGRVDGSPIQPRLDLQASVAADSGISEPDARRLAAALPNPGYVRAVTAALQTFELQAPALRLRIRDGRSLLTLPAPLSLAAANGARIQLTAPGGPLLDASDGGMHGALSAQLSGGGLPDLQLQAPVWTMRGSTLTSRLLLRGMGVDLPPLEGLNGRIEGVATATAGTVRFSLDGCTPLTARRLLVGETPLSGQSLSLCPSASPMFASTPAGWTASAGFRDLSSGLDEAQAKITGVSGHLSASGSKSLDQALLVIEHGSLADVAQTRRFNPVRTSGRLALSGGIWTGAIQAETPNDQPLGRITVRHDVARARGRAELDASHLVFARDGGLQPADLSPLAAFARNATGPAAFTGTFVWDADGMTSKGRLVADGIDFTSPIGFVASLNGAIDFTSLAPLASAPDQTLKITRVDAIVPLQAFSALFAVGAEALHVSSAAFDAAKGRISIEPVDVSFDPKAPIRGVIVIEHLDLGELIAASSLVEKIQLDAVVDGRLPFELSAKGFRFLKGQVRAIRPGHLAISRAALTGVAAGAQDQDRDSPGAPAAAPAPVNAIQDFAYQAMENLAFDTLEAGVNSTDDGRLAILFHIKGEHDPKVAEQARIGLLDLIRGKAFNKRIALPARTPVDLTLDTSLNFDDLLAAWRDAYRAQTGLEPRSGPVQP